MSLPVEVRATGCCGGWFDERAEHSTLHERVEKLESFTQANDGVVYKEELNAQEQPLVSAMKSLEPKLNAELHAQVTGVLKWLSLMNEALFLWISGRDSPRPRAQHVSLPLRAFIRSCRTQEPLSSLFRQPAVVLSANL